MPAKPINKKRLRRAPARLASASAIRKLARTIATEFQPDRIILFGSYAYGRPHADSDADILVVKSTSNESRLACDIRERLAPPFPLDIMVRTPAKLAKRLAAGDWFLREVIDKGKVLYEKTDR